MFEIWDCKEETVTDRPYREAIGKEIVSVKIEGDDQLHIGFEDGTKIAFIDQPDCCESRYMTTDDDLDYCKGSIFLGAEIKDGPNNLYSSEDEDENEYHEIQFLEIKTTSGSFTIETHNEHNGYYGGFDIEVRNI